MKRSWSLATVASFGLVLAACKPTPPTTAPWTPTVAEAEAASWCGQGGAECVPAAPGSTGVGKELRTGPEGRALIRVDDTLTVELGPATTLALVDGTPRVVELRGGTARVRRVPKPAAAAAGIAPRVAVRLADELVDLDAQAPTSLAVRARGEGRGAVTVERGIATFRRGDEAAIALHTGESAAIAAGAPLDRRAGYAGEIARVEGPRRREAPTIAVARGLGTMTARVPGTDEIVAGVRLASHAVHAVVRNGYARTEIEEVFANDGDRALEGRYVFAVPPRASVGRLALWVGDKLVEDEVVARAKAAMIFKGIVDDTVRPRDPALLEWVASGEVSLKVFPLPPKGTRKVVLAYDEALSTQGGEVRYVLPLSLGAERTNTIDALSIRVEIAGADAPTDVATPGYAANVTPGASSATAAYEAKGAAPSDDFVVSWREAKSAPAEVAAYVPSWAAVQGLGVERIAKAAADGSWAAVRVTAGLPATAPAPSFARKDRVLVIDKSFSQSRETLEGELRVALGLARALDPDERFAVLACDAACEAYPEKGLAPAIESSLEAAEKWARTLAPGGSSDVAGALIAATERLEANGAGQLVFVGDGAATSGELTGPSIAVRVHPALDAKKPDVRLFGAGATLDVAALESLAVSLAATYEPLVTGEPLAARIEGLATALRSPVLHGAKLELPSSMTEVYPHTLPALRLGQQVTVLARLSKPEGEPVKLTGELGGQPYVFETKIVWNEGTGELRQTPLLPRLWAARRIDELRTIGDAPAQKEMIDLSQKYHVLTPLTSMLVLENDAMFAQMGVARTLSRADASAGGPSSASALANQLDALQAQPLAALGASPPGATGSLDSVAKGSSGVASGGGGLGDIGGTAGIGSPGGMSREIQAPKANVSGSASVSGGRVQNAERVIAGARGRVRGCFQRGINSNPDMSGRASFTLRVDANGSVSNANVTSTGSLSSDVVGCVRSVLRNLSFDTDGAAAQVTGSFSFVVDTSTPAPRMPSPPPMFGGLPPVMTQVTTTAVIRASDDAWRAAGEDAITKLRDAVTKAPSSRKALEALVRGLLTHGRYDQALAEARRFAESDPDLAVARDLLAYAAVLAGDAKGALAAVDAAVESDARSVKAHLRAANAFESAGDERRACAHWRSLAELTRSEDHRAEAWRCRARTLGDRDAALAEAKSVEKPGAKLAKLLPLLESSQVPAFATDSAAPGQFEVTVDCVAGSNHCPTVAVIAPNGAVFSPATPADARTTPRSVAFSALRDGTYRVVLIGDAPDAHGDVTLRAAGSTQKLPFAQGGTQSVAAVQVSIPPMCCWGLIGLGAGSLASIGGVW